MCSISATAKRMKPITHDQKLQRIPSCLKRFKTIHIVNLSGKISDDSFNDVIGSRQTRIKEMGSRVGDLLQEREILGFQSTGFPYIASTFEEVYPLMPLLRIWSIKDITNHLQKFLHALSTTFVLIAKIIVEKVLHMTHTELDGNTGKNPSQSSPKSQISINYKASQGIRYSVAKGKKDRFSTLSVLTSEELDHWDILGLDICSKKQGILLTLYENGLSICQKVTSPPGFQFLSYFLKAFTLSPQTINPAKGCQRGNVQLSSHCSIRSLLRKIKPCCMIVHRFSKLQGLIKGFFTSQALISLYLYPLSIISSSRIASMFFYLRPCTIWASFFLDISLSSFSYSYIMKRRNN